MLPSAARSILTFADPSSSVPGADLVVSPAAWAAFLAFVVVVLLLDLYVFHRDDHGRLTRRLSPRARGG